MAIEGRGCPQEAETLEVPHPPKQGPSSRPFTPLSGEPCFDNSPRFRFGF